MAEPLPDMTAEWLETDCRGGFAMGTVGGTMRRRYHGLLVAASTPPTGRMMLVNALEVMVETPAGEYAISSQSYAPDVIYPDGMRRIESFHHEPWPSWVYLLEDGTRIRQEIVMMHGSPIVGIFWKVLGDPVNATLSVRPLISVRDYHAALRETDDISFDTIKSRQRVSWQPHRDRPRVVCGYDGHYEHEPTWYRNFRHELEAARGLDFSEDLISPGILRWDLSSGHEATLLFAMEGYELDAVATNWPVKDFGERLRENERERRAAFATPLERAADAYLVERGCGRTIMAGYPWFTDWGRDTFIALRGICLATGRLREGRDILLEWAGQVNEGMLPNRFTDAGDQPEYNSVDASLWFIIAVHELREALKQAGEQLTDAHDQRLETAVQQIVAQYAAGARFGIRMDADGLLAAGVSGQQLTWMDAKVGDFVVTPRIGKPVEVNALWLNALAIAGEREPKWRAAFDAARETYRERFWDAELGYCRDVVDCDHEPGKLDASLRPNQVFAVGGLPLTLLEPDQAARVVQRLEQDLLTPMGLRSLDPKHMEYCPRYEGNVYQRDCAYHQGTVWIWLIGPFVEAWLRVRNDTPEARAEARQRFVDPLLASMGRSGLGHLCEIADGDSPHTERGCPFQAWSVGEIIRLQKLVT